MEIAKYSRTVRARAKSILMMPRTPVMLPRIELAVMMHARSISHARNRLIGPASNCANRMPSGVRISSVLVFGVLMRTSSCLCEKEHQQHQFHRAKCDLRGIWDDRLVILRKKRFDEPGPNQHHSDAAD